MVYNAILFTNNTIMKRQTSIRVEDEFYQQARIVFKRFGLSFGDGVNIFLAKVAMEQAIPFELSVASSELELRKKNLDNDNNIQIFDNANDLFKELGI